MNLNPAPELAPQLKQLRLSGIFEPTPEGSSLLLHADERPYLVQLKKFALHVAPRAAMSDVAPGTCRTSA